MVKKTKIIENYSPYLWWPGWSPDGVYLTCSQANSPESLLVINVETKEIRTFQGHLAGINGATWSSDGAFLATGAWDGSVQVWTLTGKPCTRFGHLSKESVEGVDWSPFTNLIAAASSDGKVYLLSSFTGEIIYERQFFDKLYKAVWSRDGQFIGVCKERGCSFIEVTAGRIYEKEANVPFFDLAWGFDNKSLVLSAANGKLWLASRESPLKFVFLGDLGGGPIAFHHSGLIAACHADELNLLFLSGEILWRHVFESQIIAVCWKPDSYDLFVGTRRGAGWILQLEKVIKGGL